MPRVLRHNKAIAILSFGILFFAFITSFNEIIIRTIKSSFSYEQSYRLLILFISIFMVWDNRKRISEEIINPSILPGITIVLIGSGVYFVSKLSTTLMLQGLAMIITLMGLVWLIFGYQHIKILAVPIGYLIFMFSIFEELLGNISIVLQKIAAQIAGIILATFGQPVFVNGEIIELPHITLEVAKVCNGVNHIIALVALSIPIAVKYYSSIAKKLGLVIFALITGLFANGLRVAMIGWWTVNHAEESIHGPFEILYVSFILIVGLLIVGCVAIFSHSTNKSITKISQKGSKFSNTKVDWEKKITIPVLVTSGILISVIVYQHFIIGRSVPLTNPLTVFPLNIKEWSGKEVYDKNWPIKHISGDDLLKRIYTSKETGAKVGLMISYFNKQTQDKEIINQQLMWLHLKAKELTIDLNGKPIKINSGIPRGLEDQTYAGDKRQFYFWYQANGKVLTNPYKVKLEIVLSALTKMRTNAAFVVVSTESKEYKKRTNSQSAINFMRHAIPNILMNLNGT